MVTYLVGMAHAFVPLAAVIGLLTALSTQRLSRRALAAGFWCIVLGLIVGWEAHLRAGPRGSLVETRTLFEVIAIACVLVVLLAVALQKILAVALRAAGFPGALVVVAVLSAQAMFSFLELVADQSFSVASVLNTELVLNLAAILAGIVVIGLLGVFTAHAGRIAGVGATTALLAAILALQGIAWAVSGMLGLLQMRLLEITSGRVTFVAKSTELLPFAIYLHLALLALLAWLAYRQRPRPKLSGIRASAQRKILASAQTERRWLRGTVAAVAFLVAVLLYNDLYASLPPTLSPAAEKTPDDTGTIRIPVSEVSDGQLHRYAYITEDGHRVRFVLINRYDVDHVKIGVVFDACTICGDGGYIQNGHEVVCAACNVRIFVPSIGKAGGCNPIPLPHAEEAGQIVIDAAELEKGGRYFTEVVARSVKDPVSGDMVVSRSAPFRYEHDGKTYYFSGRESYDAFRADPDKYAVKK